MKRFHLHHHRSIHILFVVFLCIYLLIGLRIYPDYGVPIDEFSQIDLGRVNYDRVGAGSSEIQGHYDRYYGPAFEVPLYVFSNAASFTLGIDQMSARHLGVFLFFVFSLVAFYALLSKIHGHPAYGFLGVILLVSTPRFFAESFYNSKDIVFLSASIFVLWALTRLQRSTWVYVMLLSVTTGFGIAVRAQGLLVLPIIAVSLMITGKAKTGDRVRLAAWYVVASLAALFSMFPIFWNDTIKNIVGYWSASSNPIGVPTYYFGSFYVSPAIPWHYHFVWVAITSLLSVCVMSILGIARYIKEIWKRKVPEQTERAYLAMFFIIIGTFITSIFFHPRSYDGWRHIYYIYPCMIAFALYALRQWFASKSYRWIAIAGVVFFSLDIFLGVRFILRNHPNQYLYFNALAGGYKKAKANFDMDYWGISYKQIFAYLVSLPPDEKMSVYFQQMLPYTEIIMVPELLKRGMVMAPSMEAADLYVTINRDFKDQPPDSFHTVYAVTVEGIEVSAVYKKNN